LRIRIDVRVVPGALAEIAFLVGAAPRAPAVVRAEHAAVVGFDDRPDAIRIRGRNRDADAATDAGGKSGAGEARPGVAAVGGFVETTAAPAALEAPRRPPGLPETREQDSRVHRIHREVHGAGAVVHEQDVLPGRAAVTRAKHSTIMGRREGVAERGDIDEVRVLRMDANLSDLARLLEA